MARSIYRSDAGRAAIRTWCEERLVDASLDGETIDSPLGPTFTATSGAGHHVVLLPGTNLATATWTSLVEDLAGAGRVTAIDLPGQPGLSFGERPDRDAYAAWLRAVLRHLDRPVVVGHSLGGLVALLAASDADDIGGLVLVDPAGLIRLRVQPRMLITSLRWLRRKDDDASGALLAGMSGPNETPPVELTRWMTLVARHVRSSLAPRPLSTVTLSRVRCPVRVVTGTDDVFLPSRKVGAAAGALSGPTVATEVPGAGHLLPLERPDLVVVAVRDTIKQVRSAAPRSGH